MVIPAMNKLILIILLLLAPGVSLACFGPKLFIGTAGGELGELRYHLVSIYLHEKTGIESIRVELTAGKTAADAIRGDEIDLGFAEAEEDAIPTLLQLPQGLKLLSGERPLSDLQFSTVQRALQRLQKRLEPQAIAVMEEQVAEGVLPATVVRQYMLQQGWI